MPSKAVPIGSPELFTQFLKPEVAETLPEVAESIPEPVEDQSISAIRVMAEEILVKSEVTTYKPIDVSRLALAARLERLRNN